MKPNETIENSESLADQARGGIEHAKQFAQHTIADAREQAEETAALGEECVRDNVVPAIVAAFAGGLILGYALAHRQQPALRQRYVGEPLSHAREIAFSVLAPVAQALRDQYGNARSAAQDAAERIHDLDAEPLLKHANQWGRKLKFW